MWTRSRQTRLVLVLMILSFDLNAQDEVLQVVRTADFELSGKGDHRNWELAAWNGLDAPRRVEGSSYDTRFKIMYSASGIYMLFNCEDTVITANYENDFDELWKEDVVEAFFWTDEAYDFYFEYELSPLNKELPIMVPNVEGTFMGWRPWQYDGERKTRHATAIVESGGRMTAWIAEFFIPYALLKPMSNVPPVPGTRWRANMYRVDHDTGWSGWAWRAVQTNFHDIERFGTLIFE